MANLFFHFALDKEHKQAEEDAGILRISYDAKNRAEYITPFGFYLPDFQQTSLYFTESK